MKWNDLTLKERKRIYDSVKSNNPNITYLELKEQFDNIPAYEDGKESEEPKKTSPVSWTEDDRLFEMRKDSILRKVKRMEQDHPLEPKYYTTKSTKSKRKKLSDSNLFGVFNGLKAFDNELDKKISQSGDDIKEAAVKTNEEKYEKTKQGLNAAGILAQAGLAFAGSTAGAMGYGNLSNAIGAGQSIWNAYELANSIDEKDNLGIIQNGIPLALYGAGITKYIPRVNQMRGIDAISKIGNTSGLVWDWLPNPIIEAFKIKRDRKIQK